MSYEQQEQQRVADGQEEVAHLMPILRGRGSLWHRTDIPGLRAIVNSGQIRPNDGSLPSKYSPLYAGYHYGAVCLFDFDTAPLNDVYWAARDWHKVLKDFYPVSVVLEISRQHLVPESLIEQQGKGWMPPMQVLTTGEHYRPKWIPRVEAWYRGVIPTSAICSVTAWRWGSDDRISIGPLSSAVRAAESLEMKWRNEDEEATARRRVEGRLNISDLFAAARNRER